MSLHHFISPYLPGADLDAIRLNCIQIFSMHRQNWRVTKKRAWNNHNKAIITINRFLEKEKKRTRNFDLKRSISTSCTKSIFQSISLYWFPNSLVSQPSILPLQPKAGAPTENRCFVHSLHENKWERKGRVDMGSEGKKKSNAMWGSIKGIHSFLHWTTTEEW